MGDRHPFAGSEVIEDGDIQAAIDGPLNNCLVERENDLSEGAFLRIPSTQWAKTCAVPVDIDQYYERVGALAEQINPQGFLNNRHARPSAQAVCSGPREHGPATRNPAWPPRGFRKEAPTWLASQAPWLQHVRHRLTLRPGWSIYPDGNGTSHEAGPRRREASCVILARVIRSLATVQSNKSPRQHRAKPHRTISWTSFLVDVLGRAPPLQSQWMVSSLPGPDCP
ncbi:hypothetical protein BO70DRAFT_433271 [Aspergillus heteromorphus CBS 117.55]|uniref:Uncharacterized protein n=1 Tax=Aspergillus heteromorphus CBS 117.55 TaxID=1448321 RepID=A0A317UWH2_9EURO|nr:uncharacterized protein BO70DRAFT_433271 [Aspergillus heteromorphus CBS 117.55]PWY66025.1 hypothetical protein BO70DRAFT_433271 [Aspergillus heteromorphus CBS 117.55]